MFTNIKKCWNCKNELDERTSQKCEICGWYICENCQRCASPDFGGCKEANKRITRNVEIDKEKEKINEKKEKLKQVFNKYGFINKSTYNDISEIKEGKDIALFKNKYEDEINQILILIKDEETKNDESRRTTEEKKKIEKEKDRLKRMFRDYGFLDNSIFTQIFEIKEINDIVTFEKKYEDEIGKIIQMKNMK